jgi:hypothetical protein
MREGSLDMTTGQPARGHKAVGPARIGGKKTVETSHVISGATQSLLDAGNLSCNKWLLKRIHAAWKKHASKKTAEVVVKAQYDVSSMT